MGSKTQEASWAALAGGDARPETARPCCPLLPATPSLPPATPTACLPAACPTRRSLAQVARLDRSRGQSRPSSPQPQIATCRTCACERRHCRRPLPAAAGMLPLATGTRHWSVGVDAPFRGCNRACTSTLGARGPKGASGAATLIAARPGTPGRVPDAPVWRLAWLDPGNNPAPARPASPLPFHLHTPPACETFHCPLALRLGPAHNLWPAPLNHHLRASQSLSATTEIRTAALAVAASNETWSSSSTTHPSLEPQSCKNQYRLHILIVHAHAHMGS